MIILTFHSLGIPIVYINGVRDFGRGKKGKSPDPKHSRQYRGGGVRAEYDKTCDRCIEWWTPENWAGVSMLL